MGEGDRGTEVSGVQSFNRTVVRLIRTMDRYECIYVYMCIYVRRMPYVPVDCSTGKFPDNTPPYVSVLRPEHISCKGHDIHRGLDCVKRTIQWDVSISKDH